MADSNITKRALAASMKALMSERPFTRISVGDICNGCDMNRKSFYYHFRDKYDLVNWIFDKEFVSVERLKSHDCVWEQFSDLCQYLYDNRGFYLEAFKINGQNCFTDSFTQYCRESLVKDLLCNSDNERLNSFQAELISLLFKNAVVLWLSDKEEMSGLEFAEMFKRCVLNTASQITQYSKM